MLLKKISTLFTTSTQGWLAYSFAMLLGLTTLTSCEDPKEIGSELIAQELGLKFTDTLTVNSSTVLLDSVYTNMGNNLLVGNYTDPILGKIHSASFFQIANADTLKAKTDAVMDSLVMYLVYRTYQGDTTKSQTLNVHRLTDALSNSKDYFTGYFNNSSSAYESTPVGTKVFKPRPIKYRNIAGDTIKFDTLRIPMSRALGQELLNQRSSSDIAAGGAAFRSYFKGLALVGKKSDEGAILGFSPSYTKMSLYYHSPGDTAVSILNYYARLTVTTGYNSSGVAVTEEVLSRYNNITAERSGALAGLVKPGDILSSKLSNNEAYFQGGVGLTTKLEFPGLLRFKDKYNVAINKAELVLETKSNPVNLSIPSVFSLVESNSSNRIVKDTYGLLFLRSEGTTSPSAAVYDVTRKTFTFNITSALQNILSGRRPNTGLLLTPQIVLSDKGNSKVFGDNTSRVAFDATKTKLKIYYTYTNK
ncbi:protein of unknown function [Pseudarcicella hirudinis]|uniref:DUF4270 domain-containing protein n=1 Tax=Pseudarcicella hirudinis TaxID=1079859 RepID=A0A1I5YD76_9BACT|nr:protein of unknown function [Pseudarcicella hirudinis]